jgi:hypothetical protein
MSKKQNQNAYQVSLRNQRRDAGMCTSCGNFRAITNRVKCFACTERDRLNGQRRYQCVRAR